jgi:hypothetical protein
MERLLPEIQAQADAIYLKRLQDAVATDKPLLALAFGAAEDFDGWKSVKADTAYAAGREFGWLPVTDDSAPMPEEVYYDMARRYGQGFVGPEPLAHALLFWPYPQPPPRPLRWSLSSGTPRTFRIDAQAGLYNVRIVNVNASWTNLNFRISGMVGANGKTMLFDEPFEKGSVVARDFQAQSQDGHLDLTFGGATGWGVAAVIVKPRSAQPAPHVQWQPLRDWQVSPRHTNPEWWRTVTTPLDGRLNDLPLAGWTRLHAACDDRPSPWAGLPVIDLGSNRGAETGDMVYAVATFDAPGWPRPKLCFGSTSQATLWLNGRYLGVVPNEKGLREEFVVPVELQPGANKLVVKLQRFWERRWLFATRLKQTMADDGPPR